jgi:hypothetical protein
MEWVKNFKYYKSNVNGIYNIITVNFILVNRSQKMQVDLKQKWLVFVFICSIVNRFYGDKYTQDSSMFLQSFTLLSH